MRIDLKKSTLPSRLATGARNALRPARLLSCLAVAGMVAVGTVTMTTAPAAAQGELTAGATDSGSADSGSTDSDGSAQDSSADSGSGLTAGVSQPSEKEMNKAGDHVMGAGVREGESAAKKSPSDSASKGSKSKGSTSKNSKSKGAKKKSGGSVRGVDVSRWDELSKGDWKSMAKDDIGFAYVKATEGTDLTSSSYKKQYKDSANAGLVRGAYHFALPNKSSGAKQAAYFVKHGGGWKADGKTLPPLLDMEYNPYGSTCYGKSNSKMVSWIQDFSNSVKKRTGRTPAIYTTRNWWEQCTGNSSKLSDNPLFLARYPKKFSDGPGKMPGGWKGYTFWQYTEDGKPVSDMDVFNGSRDELKDLANRKG